MRAVKLLTVMVFTFFLAGCWGSRESDEIAYVMAMGFDKGEKGNITVTFQIANPKVIAGMSGGGGGGVGGDSQNKPFLFSTTEALSPIAAFNLLNAIQSREISLLHTKAFIFSEELAREGLAGYLNPLNRYRETRGTSFVFISRGKARNFMQKNQPLLEVSPSKQYEMIADLTNLHGMAPHTQFREFYQHTKSLSIDPTVPLVGINETGLGTVKRAKPHVLGDYLAGDFPAAGESKAQIIGTAVFRNDRMVGELTGDESMHMLILQGRLQRSLMVLDDPLKPGNHIGLMLHQSRSPVVKVSFADEVPAINVEVFQEPSIVGISSGVNYEEPKIKATLEKLLSDIITQRCNALINRSQNEFRSDIFGFGEYAKRHFLTLDKWQKYNWPENYIYARVNVKTNVKIRRTGLQLKTKGTG
ncbi:MAG: Ger(x)C family spore germination protein [Bacillota bacterium]